MKTLRIEFLSLFLFAMQDDGGDKPDRNKMFVEQLGIDSATLALLNNPEIPIGDVSKSFTTNFTGVVRQSHTTTWNDENTQALTTTIQTGTHKALQGKLLKAFPDLDATALLATEKPTAAILEAIAADYEKLKNSGDSSVGDLRKLLEDSNLKNKGFEEEFTKLKAIAASIPDLQKQWTQDSESKIWLNSQKAKALSSFENLAKHVDLGVIEALLAPICDISVVIGQDGKRTHIIKDKQGAILKRTETDIYHSLADLIKDKVLVPMKFINLQNPAPEGGNGQPPQNNNNNNSSGAGWPTGGMSGSKK